MKNAPRPKVLVISHNYPSLVDGISGIFIHQYVMSLMKLGVELQVVSPVPWAPKVIWFKDKWRRCGSFPGEEKVDGVSVKRPRYIELPFNGFRPFSGWSMYKSLLPFLKKLRKEFGFNIIHTHTITPDGHAGILLKRIFNVPSMCSVRGSDLKQYPFESKKMHKVSIRVLEESDAILAVSNDLANQALKMADIKSPPYVIHNGVDTSKFHKYENKEGIRKSLGIRHTGRAIVFIGRCEKEKGIFELLDAFLKIKKAGEDISLVIVGEGKDKEKAKGIVDENNMGGNVVFAGNVPHEEIPGYLNAGDIFALPTYSEGMANVIYEAMACGLPVVSTNVGGIPEVITHGVEGFLCNPGDSEMLEKYIRELIRNPVMSQEMGRKAEEKVLKRFTWESNAEEHLRAYEDILAGK
jgi:glycosyltransferase involved in cell wall biosynthesis